MHETGTKIVRIECR